MWILLGSTQAQQGNNDIFVFIGPSSVLKHKSMKPFEQRPYVPFMCSNYIHLVQREVWDKSELGDKLRNLLHEIDQVLYLGYTLDSFREIFKNAGAHHMLEQLSQNLPQNTSNDFSV